MPGTASTAVCTRLEIDASSLYWPGLRASGASTRGGCSGGYWSAVLYALPPQPASNPAAKAAPHAYFFMFGLILFAPIAQQQTVSHPTQASFMPCAIRTFVRMRNAFALYLLLFCGGSRC